MLCFSIGIDPITGEYMCETLSFGIVGDADDYRRFQIAYGKGSDFAGIPMGAARGPNLEAGVERACSLDGHDFTSSYAGLEVSGLSSEQPDGTHQATLSNVSGSNGGDSSYLYLQNAGPSCTGIELAFDGNETCQVPALAPGEAFAFDVSACTGSGFSGDVTIASGEPLAIIEEVYDFNPPTDPLPEIPPSPDPDPAPVADSPLLLPVMRERANLPSCNPVVEVSNPHDTEEAVAVMIVWPEQGQCPPQANGPLKVECSGVLRPGESWSFFDSYIPADAASAEIYSFTARELEEIGISFGFDDISGDIMCENLAFTAIDNADNYRNFKSAYLDGSSFFGFPMDIMRGVDLKAGTQWACEATPTSYAQTIDYAGFASSDLVTGLTVPDMAGNSNDSNSYLYIQNAGLDCADVDLDFGAGGQCELSIAPGETAQYDAATCTGPDFNGPVEISGSELLAIITETMALPPDVSVDVTMLSFGSVTAGGNSQKTIEICNNGLGNMKVSSVSLTGLPFSIVDDTCTDNLIGNAQCCQINVAFSPGQDQIGVFNDLLVIRTNDSEDEVINIQINGLSTVSVPTMPHVVLLLLMLALGSFVAIRRHKGEEQLE